MSDETHNAPYAMDPGATKMYHTLRVHYWWPRLKKDVVEFMSKCLVCQQIKVEHQKPACKLQSLPLLEWKWEHITIDFVSGLPCTLSGHDMVWVIVDRLTKSAYFITVKKTFSLNRYTQLYVKEIVRLDGTPISIVSDRDP